MSSPIRILTIIGARPQIIKAAALSRAIGGAFPGRLKEIILHTGQHYDQGMSQVFFDELGIPRPDIQLSAGSGSHGVQTARMLEGIEKAIDEVRPHAVVVYGDTNSTLAGALAASKLHVPIAHIEAGLRSFNKNMPEEINRIITDHCSTWLFCPTTTAVKNLQREGFKLDSVHKPSIDRPAVILSGDVMYDNSLHFARLAEEKSKLIQQLGLKADNYFLVTIHRAANTDDPQRLSALIDSLQAIRSSHGMDIVLPLHPRTSQRLEGTVLSAIRSDPGFHVISPVGFLDMIALERNARLVLTDSGGVQKEAYFFGKPCVIFREETEWTEIVEAGMAILAVADPERISNAVDHFMTMDRGESNTMLFGNGRAAERICEELISSFTA